MCNPLAIVAGVVGAATIGTSLYNANQQEKALERQTREDKALATAEAAEAARLEVGERREEAETLSRTRQTRGRTAATPLPYQSRSFFAA